MTNDRIALKDIFKCPKCEGGYMIVKRNKADGGVFYGCTNYEKTASGCRNIVHISDVKTPVPEIK
jgi:ssDNA-binding Zn-finger/Zn-ribbon topoisomerase 1